MSAIVNIIVTCVCRFNVDDADDLSTLIGNKGTIVGVAGIEMDGIPLLQNEIIPIDTEFDLAF
jgi:hypothetical protein